MISLVNVERYCSEDISLIENYEQAKNDTEMWECHHKREIQDGYEIWTMEELIKIGQYFNVKANELIFLKRNDHINLHHNAVVPKHKRTRASCNSYGKPYSDFGIKFKEQYGKTKYEDLTLYNKELRWYHRHNHKCRWED